MPRAGTRFPSRSSSMSRIFCPQQSTDSNSQARASTIGTSCFPSSSVLFSTLPSSSGPVLSAISSLPKPFSLSGLTPTGSSRQTKCPTRYPATYRAHPAAPLSGCTSVITHNRNRHFAEAMRSPWVPMTHHNIGHHSMSPLTTGTQMSSVSLQAMVPTSMLLREISATAFTRQSFSPSVSHPTGISISRHTQRRPLPCTSPYVYTETKQHRYW